MLERKPARAGGGSRRADGAQRDRGENDALRIVNVGDPHPELPLGEPELAGLKKSDPRKVQVALLLRTHTTVSNVWIARNLAMDHPGPVSRSVADARAKNEMANSLKKPENMLVRVL